MILTCSSLGGIILNHHKVEEFKEENGKFDAPVSWNFQKFLVDREGNVLQSFAPGDKVTDEKVLKVIEEALEK